ncbi:FGGY-family carbohydrate kinase [Pelagibacterium sp. 26DY04]|uniref:FGGY-family carbohydrate kinase n=1 Tax=Pelagibacterium sp. 26DY04 TaxID=2967130 RepID=UPI002815A03C|nr:FGGY-family carbohydrate kinase [Pelagibacterium sp. 26DY04]WMT87317.1 FGGY-family carbohydrate kinase [Pelagibacterium sp. 26DY04]
MDHFIGIDVGTGSARAGVFDRQGKLLGSSACPIETFRPAPDFAQQRSAEIWQAVARSVREAVKAAGVSPESVGGLGFDATCSLVVAGEGDGPVSVSPDGAADQDVILWMDHRAIGDAEAITATGAGVLDHIGGVMSPEMELPKLVWLKRELPQSWQAAKKLWDLPDWLVYRATGATMRSLCSPVCKWTYLGHRGLHGEGWDKGFLSSIGLEDLVDDGFDAIGTAFAAAGVRAGGLTEQAAGELGLVPGIAVSTGLIDAYSGALGTLGVADSEGNGEIEGRLAVIAGTSTCHISLTREPKFVPGVWGPYYSVLLDGLWANEGGQSAAGALLDAVIARHSAAAQLIEKAEGRRLAEALDAHLETMSEESAFLTRNRHVQPDFHGNRSPLAEPWRKGAIVGLTLESGIDDLALDYLATQQALAYGTRHIIEALSANGVVIDTLVVSGGLARNRLYLREHADATGCKVVVPDQTEPVLLGSAMIAAAAAGAYSDITAAMGTMSGAAKTIEPRSGEIAAYHDAKYAVFRRMQDDYAAYRDIMSAAETE